MKCEAAVVDPLQDFHLLVDWKVALVPNDNVRASALNLTINDTLQLCDFVGVSCDSFNPDNPQDHGSVH
jgi:hypothetical protein